MYIYSKLPRQDYQLIVYTSLPVVNDRCTTEFVLKDCSQWADVRILSCYAMFVCCNCVHLKESVHDGVAWESALLILHCAFVCDGNITCGTMGFSIGIVCLLLNE